MRIVSKSEAIKHGLRRYFTGKPCVDGHISERDLQGRCLDCRRIKDVAIHRRHYIKHRDSILAKGRRRYMNLSPELKQEARDRWTKQRREYAKQNRVTERQRRKEYYTKNKPKYTAYVHTRRARKLLGGGTHTPADIQNMRRSQDDCCAMCNKNLYGGGELDHIIPLALGGSNDPANLELLCMPCNRFKSDKSPSQLLRAIEEQIDLASIDWEKLNRIQEEDGHGSTI